MRVYAEREWARQTIAVYVELRGPDEHGDRLFETFVTHGEDATLTAVRVRHGEPPPMWLRIPVQVAQALGEALAPRPEVTERHLDDALVVRDRLLGLVERVVDADLARESS